MCDATSCSLTLVLNILTSSTAQGSGGSFKNRKPIGEIGCCESGDGRANPLMDRKMLEVSSLSLSFSDYLPTYLPIYLLSNYLSIYLYLSIYPSIYDFYLSVYLSTCLSVVQCHSVYGSVV